MIDYKNVKLIKDFRTTLDYYNYNVIYQKINGSLNYFFNPFNSEKQILHEMESLEESYKCIYSLLLIGQPLNTGKVISLLGEKFINDLINLNIVEKSDDIIYSKGYSLVSYFENYFLVNTPDFYHSYYNNTHGVKRDVYIGLDSFMLPHIIPNNNITTYLDLCTGSGIQAISAAPYAKKGYAIDYNPNTIPVTKFNVILNNREEVIDVLESDLYSSVEKLSFDMIISNPPFIPVPSKIKYPVSGDGGEDGLKVIRRIIEGYDKHLHMNGIGIMIGQALGDMSKPFLLNTVRKIIPRNYNVTLFLYRKDRMEGIIDELSRFSADSFKEGTEKYYKEEWMEICDNIGATHYYTFCLKIVKDGNAVSKFTTVNLYKRWTKESRPLINGKLNIEPTDNAFLLNFGNGKGKIIDRTLFNVIRHFNGKNSIYDLVQMAYQSFENRYFYDSVIEICQGLEDIGVVSKDESLGGNE